MSACAYMQHYPQCWQLLQVADIEHQSGQEFWCVAAVRMTSRA